MSAKLAERLQRWLPGPGPQAPGRSSQRLSPVGESCGPAVGEEWEGPRVYC